MLSPEFKENTDQKKLRIWTLFTQCRAKSIVNFKDKPFKLLFFSNLWEDKKLIAFFYIPYKIKFWFRRRRRGEGLLKILVGNSETLWMFTHRNTLNKAVIGWNSWSKPYNSTTVLYLKHSVRNCTTSLIGHLAESIFHLPHQLSYLN